MKLTTLALLACCSLVVGIGPPRRRISEISEHQASLPNDKVSHKLVDGIEKFSITFLLRTSMDSGKKNIVVSPYSVWSILTLLSKGAKGVTLKQLTDALRHPKMEPKLLRQTLDFVEKSYLIDSKSTNVNSKNFIFNDVEVIKDFQNSISPTCNTYVIPTPFSRPDACNTINRAVTNATRGEFDEVVLKQDLINSHIVLANAMYSETKWRYPFNSIFSKKEPFYDHNNKKIGYVDMMIQKGLFKYVNMVDFKAHVLEMPTGDDGRTCMLALMPHEGMDLKSLFLSFTYVPIKTIFMALDSASNHRSKVEVHFPRFTTETNILLNGILFNMGIQDIFDSNNANLSGFTNQKGICVSRYIHTAKIAITEGTESDIFFGGYPHERNLPKFVVNRPFMYLVIEKATNVIMLGGIYAGPD